ncbi:ABC transporter substrate-binding protein [Microbacterium sp. E-13]|uniref:ABC transporter substrate-binding protein n=1 Tax=Microbacterium sp. E-13 TaxID=3404048 RepID=UPI003CE94A24
MPHLSRLKKSAAATTIVAALALAGCSGESTASPTPGASGAGEPVEGGDLTIVSLGEMTCVDPWQTVIRVALQWHRQVVDSLIYEDREGAFHPWLAESYEVNDDATQFTFTLRDDVTFSDGSALDAETVKANLDALDADPRYTIAQGFLSSYAGTEVVDEHTAVVSFDEPNAPFLYGVSTPNMGIISTASAALDAGARCQGDASGSGPFVLDGFRSGEQAVLARNDDYAWAPEGLENKGPAYLDTITVNQVADQTVIGQTGLAGDAQIVHGAADPFVPQLEQAGWQRFNEPDPASVSSFIFYPGNGIAGSDEAVRQAFNLALDREELVAATASAIYSEPSGVLNTAHPYFVDQSDLLEQDVDAANELLDDDGWEVGSDGIRTRDGERLSIEAIGNAAIGDALAVAAQQLEEVGIELTIRPVTFTEEAALRAEGRLQVRVNQQTGAEPTVLPLLFDGNLPEGMEDLVAAQASTVDVETRREAAAEMESLLLEDGWLAPLWQSVNQPVYAPEVHGVVRDVGGLFMLGQVWLDPQD